MRRRGRSVDHNRVTAAVASASWGWSLPAGRSVAPRRDRTGDPGSGAASFSARSLLEPKALILVLLLLLAVIVGARGPITKALGTAGSSGPTTTATATDAGTPPAAAVAGAVPGRAPAAPHVNLHPAHNPFAARVSQRGSLLPFAVPPAGWSLRTGHAAQFSNPGHAAQARSGGQAASAPTATTPSAGGPHAGQASGRQAGTPAAGAATAGSCPSHSSPYTVRAGDSLWAIASRQLPPNASNAALVKRVNQIYGKNHHRIGANPSVVSTGTVLCLPGH